MSELQVQEDVLKDEMESLSSRLGRQDLRVLETGCIRTPEEATHIGYGWSTLTFARRMQEFGGRSVSVDLDISVAADVLGRKSLTEHVKLVESDSLAFLDSLVDVGESFDFILLDSASDPRHILNEWERAVKLVVKGGVIVIDDVAYDKQTHGTKGSMIIEKLDAAGTPWRRLKRWTGYAWIGMIAIDF